MSQERREHGPDFLYRITKDNTAFLQLVNILVQKGYAVSLAEESASKYLAVNASPKAREVIGKVVMDPEFVATEGAFSGSKRGGTMGTMWDVVEQCEWPDKIKKRVLATYLFNREIIRGRGEAVAETEARKESRKRATPEDIPMLLSSSISRAEIELAVKGLVR